MTRPVVLGAVVDAQTRCVHYRGPLDIVAIRFACCGGWYPCLHCHDEVADHAIRPWPLDARDEQAVLCGACGATLAIGTYLRVEQCPYCAAPFNPGCALHHCVYFRM
ncbi:CHY zinc finger protein [Microbacterium sp. M28]|uniref:CHY zinc finger protein n=1 Tax=Microbacterium sp. M28 TaxID=2962064 RepID=UPI0021F3DA89|nr:CHY zinc finger protein [Microbacterium sp. M28]UYO95698.1 CHY zinc finger protein [Microbacterium sp. M28]